MPEGGAGEIEGGSEIFLSINGVDLKISIRKFGGMENIWKKDNKGITKSDLESYCISNSIITAGFITQNIKSQYIFWEIYDHVYSSATLTVFNYSSILLSFFILRTGTIVTCLHLKMCFA